MSDVTPDPRAGARAAARVAATALLALWVACAGAEGTPAAAVPASAAASNALGLEEARALLGRLQPGGAAAQTAPLVEERRNLAARLVLLLETDPTAGDAAPHDRSDALPDPPAAMGAPPHRVAQVDALRDHRDALRARAQALAVAASALDGQVASLLEARRRAEAGLRLRQDQLARNTDPATRERLEAEAEAALLEARVAALEANRADADRQATRGRLARLEALASEAEQAIGRTAGQQFIDDAALAEVGTASAAARQWLAEQRRRLSSQLAQRPPAAGPSGVLPAVADRERAALHGRLAALDELDQIEAGRKEVWRQRQLLLMAVDDADRRTEAQAVARRSVDQLQLRAQATGERLGLVRLALRAQRLRAESQPDGPAAIAEQRALAAMQQEADTLEMVEERLRRLQALLQRSLDDLATAVGAEPMPIHQRAVAALNEAAAAVWRHELFSVSETTRVDGRTVTLDYGVTVGKSVGVLVLFVLGWLAAHWLSRGTVGLVGRQLRLSPHGGRVLYRWMLSVLLLGVLIIVLKMARIPLTVFAFLGGALAIGVGFGTQTIIKNVICGVIILLERKVRVGDTVTIDGVSGTVTAVDLRATTVRGSDGIAAIVPNSHLLEQRVSNWSYGSPTVRRSIRVGLHYGSDARRAADAMLACTRANSDTLREPEPEVLFESFAPDAQMLLLRYWVRLGGQRDADTVDSELRHAITQAFAAVGLLIAAPQRDVRLHWPAPAPMPTETRA